jgi:hypothetical protein
MSESALHHASSRLLQARTVRSAVAAGDYPVRTGARLAGLLEALGRRNAYDPVAHSREDDASADRAMAVFLSRILSHRGPDIHDYLSGTIGYSPERPTGIGHFCGQSLLAIAVVPRWTTAGVRDLYICERCGPAFAVPHGSAPPRISVNDGARLRLDFAGPAVADGWYTASRQPVGGHAEPSQPPRPVEAGQEGVTVALPLDATLGLRRFAVALVIGGECVIAQFPIMTNDE